METKTNLAPAGAVVGDAGGDVRQAGERRRDRYVHYSHQMTHDTAESSARTLIRAVPLIYGGLLGGLVGSVLLGLVFGLMMSLAFDLRMGDKSMSLPLLRLISGSGRPSSRL